jgi:hypothetical protein
MASRPDILVHWVCDGQEHDEPWASTDAFLDWVAAEGLSVQWTAYEADEDDDWIVVARGRT